MLIGFSEAPQDISFPAMSERQEAVNAIVQHDPDVDHVVSFIGGGPAVGGQHRHRVRRAQAARRSARRAPTRSSRGCGRSSRSVAGHQRCSCRRSQDVRVGGRSARTQYQYTLQDADLDELRTWAPRVLERLRKLPELKDVATDQQTAGLQLDVDDRSRHRRRASASRRRRSTTRSTTRSASARWRPRSRS